MKNIVVFMSMEEEANKTVMDKIAKYNLSSEATFHFVHVVELTVHAYILPVMMMPLEEEHPEMERKILEKMNNITSGVKNNKIVKCYFSEDPKYRALEYLKSVDADLAITLKQERKGLDGLFSSSFSEYLIKTTKSDVLVLH